MRSRNGNHSFTRTVLIFLLSSLALDAKEYLISYRYVVKDAILYNESLSISSSMTKCLGKPLQALTFTSYGNENLKQNISENSELFVDYIHKLGLQVEHKGITNNFQNKSTTILTLKTTCFKVDFNDNLVRIAPLK
ncbi:hypothetical protein [Sulfurimonas sp. CS5]|jgi:CII-binding regulator of phage lambda lysogenization HflD|uniref:hypothetical protein n=1 Tax=Sulfurimonas sp. CS5 TaxID=3391145 RepID=UPI0039E811BF